MPRNKGKGNKRNGQKKSGNNEGIQNIVFREEGQEYAQVTRMLGNGRLEAYCFDGKTRQCHIRGQMQRKVWINVNDVILISLREYEENKGDVIKKYNSDEVIQLKKYREIPEKLQTDEEKAMKADTNVNISFGGAATQQERNAYDISDDDDSYDDIGKDVDDDEEEEEDDYYVPAQKKRDFTLDDL